MKKIKIFFKINKLVKISELAMFDKLYSVFVTNWYTFCWNYQTLTVSKGYGISFVVLSVVVNFLI